MKYPRLSSALFAAAVLPVSLFFTGCESTDAKYVDSKGPETVVSLDQINIQDWTNASDQMISSLLTSGVLERAPEQPAIMAVSRIVNNTQQQVDTDMLTKKIRVALNQSGKVVTTTTIGLGGKAEDPLAKDAADMNAFMSGEKQQTKMPYYTLSGKLLEDRARAGSTCQVTYTFQLSLTEVRSGLAVWEDEKQITKQGKKASVGW